jgi:hypothetical protein
MPMLALVNPLPRELTTPPVTKICLVMRVGMTNVEVRMTNVAVSSRRLPVPFYAEGVLLSKPRVSGDAAPPWVTRPTTNAEPQRGSTRRLAEKRRPSVTNTGVIGLSAWNLVCGTPTDSLSEQHKNRQRCLRLAGDRNAWA